MSEKKFESELKASRQPSSSNVRVIVKNNIAAYTYVELVASICTVIEGLLRSAAKNMSAEDKACFYGMVLSALYVVMVDGNATDEMVGGNA